MTRLITRDATFRPAVWRSAAVVDEVPFNRPRIVGDELDYVRRAIEAGHTSSGGPFTRAAAELLRDWHKSADVLLTTSCTDALEMVAMLLEIEPGDVVVVPSFTFTSTALAFARAGATLRFADIEPRTLGLDPASVAELLGPEVKAVVTVNYAGVPCDLDDLVSVIDGRTDLVENNAHGLFGRHRGRPLGTFGRFSTLSFHETKNFFCGEGGALVVRDAADVERAHVLADKGALVLRVPLGHDESVDALRGRDFLHSWSSVSGYYWMEYRAPGLPLLMALPFRVLGASSLVARLVVTCCGLALIILTWAIARRLASPAAGITAAASLCLTTGVMSSSTMVLADVPGAAFSLAAVFVFLIECQSGRLRWSPIVVPLLATTAAGTIAATWLVTMTTLLTQHRSPLQANSDLIGSKGLTAASGWREFSELITPFEPQSFPYWNRATLALTLTLFGLAAAIVVGIVDRNARRGIAIGLGVGAITLAGLLSTAGKVDHNYLVMPAPCLAIVVGVGMAGAMRGASAVLRPTSRGAVAIGALAAALVFVGVLATVTTQVEQTHLQYAGFDWLRELAVETGQELGPGCIVITSCTPQVGWYSNCKVAPMEWPTITVDNVTGTPEFAVLLADVLESLRGYLQVPLNGSSALFVVEGASASPQRMSCDRRQPCTSGCSPS